MFQPLEKDENGNMYIRIPDNMAQPKYLDTVRVTKGEKPEYTTEYKPPVILEPVEMWFTVGNMLPDGRRPVYISASDRRYLESLGQDPKANLILYPMYLSPVGTWETSDEPLIAQGRYWYEQSRIMIPSRIVYNSRMDDNTRRKWGFLVSVTTEPVQTTSLVGYEPVEEYENVYSLDVVHLHNSFPCIQMGKEWRWYLPDSFEYSPLSKYMSYSRIIPLYPTATFKTVFDLGFQRAIGADIYNSILGSVEVDLGVAKSGFERKTKDVAYRNGYAYRSISNRNYSLKKLNDYPFFCEIRATYLTMYPREYITVNDYTNVIVEMLNITTYNMSQHVFVQERRDMETHQTTLTPYLNSRKLKRHTDTRTPKYNRKPYGSRYGTKDSFRGGVEEEVITEGTELNQEVSGLEFEIFDFEKCIKYARIINRYNMYYEYSDDWINNEAEQSPNIFVDKKGFIWKM